MQAWGQEDPHANCAMVGWVPEGILERPLPLRAATGNSADVVTTGSSEARAYYLQGLNYLHGYAWIEGARSFQQAIRLDPNLAMAHWGLSRIYSGLDDHAGAVSEASAGARARESSQRTRAAAHRAASAAARVDLRPRQPGLVRGVQAGHRQGDRGRHRRCRAMADSRQCRGTHGRGSRPARRRRVDRVLSGSAARWRRTTARRITTSRTRTKT